MRPLVFLDMDDVMCLNEQYNSIQMLMCYRKQDFDWPELWGNLVDAGAAENLRQLNAEFAPLYVISSSWATYMTREQMIDVLTRTQLHFVVENLHSEWRTPRARASSRRDEIDWWVEAHREPGQPFLILDDSWSGATLANSPLDLDGYVVLCVNGAGFTTERLEEARRQFEKQGVRGAGTGAGNE